MKDVISQFLAEVNARNQNEPEFMQAVTEVVALIVKKIKKRPTPRGIITFRKEVNFLKS